MKRWISFAVAAFALNFAWEMAQMTAYAAMRGRPLEATLLPCARAAGSRRAGGQAAGEALTGPAPRRAAGAPAAVTRGVQTAGAGALSGH